jgi:signal peptidase I
MNMGDGQGARARGVYPVSGRAAVPTPQARPAGPPEIPPRASARVAGPRGPEPTRSGSPRGDSRGDSAPAARRAGSRHDGRSAEQAYRPDRTRPRHRAMRARRPMPFWQELPLLLLIALCLALLIKTFLVQAFFIPSGSMENTLRIRDRVLVNKLIYDMRDPVRGEVIVFRGTDSWAPEGPPVTEPSGPLSRLTHGLAELVGLAQPDERDFVKRVIGLPGDTVACCDDRGRVTVNDRPLDEPYVFDNTPAEQRAFGPVNVPADRLFVMGDHRKVSADSRQYLQDRWQGTVPLDQVIGRAFVKVWPTDHWGLLPVPETFEAVPTALGPPEHHGAPGLVALPVLLAAGEAPPFSRPGQRRARTLGT